jgi:hypothetical protein
VVYDDDNLGQVLQQFKNGRAHMAVVRGVVEHDDGRDNTVRDGEERGCRKCEKERWGVRNEEWARKWRGFE